MKKALSLLLITSLLIVGITSIADAVTPSGPGQTTAAHSMSVVFASDATLPSVTVTGGATSAKQDTGNTSLSSIDGKIATAAAATDAKSNPTAGLVQTLPLAFNGTSWDRVRSAQSTPTGTLTGFQNSLPLAIYNSSAPTATNGQVLPFQVDASGFLKVVEQFQPSYEDNTAGVAKVENRYSYTNISTATTTVVKSGAGFLHLIVIGKHVASNAITIYDNTAASGTKISTITPGTLLTDPPIQATYDVVFSTGLTVVTAGASDITVSWR